MTGGTDFDKIFKDHIKVFSPKKGENRVRFLPATWPDPAHYGWDIFVHYGVGPDRQSYLDLKRMLDKPDPIDEERNELRRLGRTDEQSLKEIRDLNSTRRVACYIIDRDNEADGVQAWPMAQTLDQDISASSVDDDGAVLDIDHPEEGYDVSFRKEGEKLNTKYKGITISRRPSRLGKKEWLEYAIKHPLPDQLQFFSYEDIAKEFGGGGVHRERAEDELPARGEDRDVRGSRDREEGSSRDDDRGRDRGSRDDAPSRRDDRDSDRSRGAARDRERAEEEITWETVEAMTGAELDALVTSDDRLSKIDPAEATDDAQLRAWICEDLKLEKLSARESVTRRRAAAPADDAPEDKLAALREARSRR